MTISTADFGGTGNGLGLPIANPLYGPANAAIMAQNAQQQNTLNAQATTRSTDANTNRTNLLAPFEAQQMAATARNTNATAAGQEFNNKVNDAFGVSGAAAEKQAALEKMQMDNGSQRRTQEENALMMIGPRLDGKTADEQNGIIRDWFTKQGLPPDHAEQWGNVVRSHEKNPPSDTGPANAAAPRGGGAETTQSIFELRNPALAQAKLETASREKISANTLSMEEKITRMKMDTEKDLAMLDPEKASQGFTTKYYQLKDSKDPEVQQMAEEYRKQAIDAMLKKGYFDQAASFAKTAYNPTTPLLQDIASKATGKPAVAGPVPTVNGATASPPVTGPQSIPLPSINGQASGGGAPAAASFQEGATAINPNTKQKMIFRSGQWVPFQ